MENPLVWKKKLGVSMCKTSAVARFQVEHNHSTTRKESYQVVQMLLRRCSFHQPKTAKTNKPPPCMGTETGGSGPVPSSPCKMKAGVPERQGLRDDEGVTFSSVTQNPIVDDRGASLLPTGDGDRRTRADDDRRTRVAIVPLSRLILSGNCLTDAGASALAPLVQASHSLEEVDLRGNCIGKKGKLALKKSLASNPWVHSVTVEDTRSSSISEGNRGEMSRGVVLRAKRRPRTTSGDRAKAYAFETIPPSPKLGRGRYTTTTTTTTTTTATIVGKLTEIFPESVSPFRATRSSDERKVEEGSTDSRARFRATRSSSDGNIETRCNANDDDHAPAVHGEESSSALNRASREQAFGRLHGNNLRLVSGGVGGAAMDSCGENVAVIAASCKIDLRGCSRWQPLSFGAIDVPFGAIASPFGKIARPIGALDESGYPPRVLHSFQDTPSAAVHPPMHALQETPSPVVRRGQRFQPLSFGREAAAEGVSRSRVHWSQEEDTSSVVRAENDRLMSEGRRGGCLRRVDVSRADVISRSRRRKINPELERAVQRSSPSADWFAGISTRVPLGDQVADTLTSIGSVKAVRLQRQRRGQRQRREDDRQPAKSESQDADDLKSLLTASHRIFNEIEGHCQETAPPAATKDEGATFDVVEGVCENRTSQHHGPAYATTLSPPVKKRGTDGVVEHGTTRDAAVRASRNHHQHHDHHRPVDAIPIALNTRGVVGIAGERNKLDADVDANKTSNHDGRTDAIPIATNNRGADGVARAGSKQLGAVVRKNRTSYHPTYDALPTTDGGAGRKPYAVVRGNGNSHCRGPADATVLTRSAGKRDADSARGQPPPQITGFTGTGGTHYSIGKKITNDPPSAEKLAEDDFHSGYSHENYGSDHDGGWVYDEATGSWMYSNANEVAPAPATAPSDKACDDAGGNADDDGWRYDEHRAAWYYEEPATIGLKTTSDPQEEQHQEVTQQQAYCEQTKDVLQHQAAPEAVTDGIGPGSMASVGGARVAAAEGGSRGSTACVGARVSGDRGNTAAAAGGAVAGKWHGGARSQPSSRKSLRKARFGTASRALLLRTDVEGPGSTKVLHGTGDGGDGNDEVGGVVAERIKALQLALKAKP